MALSRLTRHFPYDQPIRPSGKEAYWQSEPIRNGVTRGMILHIIPVCPGKCEISVGALV
jgi:hypothetical protein